MLYVLYVGCMLCNVWLWYGTSTSTYYLQRTGSIISANCELYNIIGQGENREYEGLIMAMGVRVEAYLCRCGTEGGNFSPIKHTRRTRSAAPSLVRSILQYTKRAAHDDRRDAINGRPSPPFPLRSASFAYPFLSFCRPIYMPGRRVIQEGR